MQPWVASFPYTLNEIVQSFIHSRLNHHSFLHSLTSRHARCAHTTAVINARTFYSCVFTSVPVSPASRVLLPLTWQHPGGGEVGCLALALSWSRS